MPYLVVDHPFNQANYPHLIGQIHNDPPGYAAVMPIDTPEREAILISGVVVDESHPYNGCEDE